MTEHAFPQELPQSGPDQTFNFKVKDDDIVDNSSWFISKIFGQLTSIAHVFLEWMALLTPYCLTFAVACYLLGSSSVVLSKVRENMIVIIYNLRMFISMIFKVLTSMRYWENTCVILENLCWFCLQILKASKNFAHSCFKWITVLASYSPTFSDYLLGFFSLILLRVWENMIFIQDNLRIIIATIFEVLTNIRYWEISCAILESLRLFTSQISDALINITHSFLEFIYLLASCCSTVSCYLLTSIATVVVRVWEIMVAILDNLRIFTAMMFEVLRNIRYWEISCTILDNLLLFILKISDALTSITHRLLEFIYLLASCCSTVSCYLLTSIATVVVRVWEIMVAILDNLRIFTAMMFEVLRNIRYWEISCTILDNLLLFILKISDALTSITHRLLEFIYLLASCCSTVSCYLLTSIATVVVRVWEIMVAILDNLRIFTAMMFEVLTNIRYWEISCATLNNLRWLILKISSALKSIIHRFLECIDILASFCLTVPCHVLKSISAIFFRLWKIMVAILDNLSIFSAMMFELLTNIRHWDISCSISDNLRLFILKILDASSSFTGRFLEWIYLLASYCLAVPCYISTVVAKLWEIIVAILNYLRFFILKISDALTGITNRSLEWIFLLPSYCLTVPCYVLKSISVVVAKLWEILAAISDNLRLFILKIPEALTSIIDLLLKWINLPASYCMITVPCFVLKSISVVAAKLWEIMMGILDNLRLFIIGINDALKHHFKHHITHHFLEWINLLALYCVTVPFFVLKSISAVVARLCEILVANLDNLRLFIMKVSDELTRLTRRFLEWIIGRMYDNDHCGTKEGDQPIEGKTLTARFIS